MCLQIQKRIDAQKEENALLNRLRELERQVELNKIRESIARLEAEQAKQLGSAAHSPAALATATKAPAAKTAEPPPLKKPQVNLHLLCMAVKAEDKAWQTMHL